MNKQPKLMDISRMRDIFAPLFEQISKNIYISNELAMLHGEPMVFRLLVQQTPPFVINDHRLGIITRGEGEVNFNLVDHHLTEGTLIYIGPGTIITPIRFSNDLELQGIGLFADFPMPFADGQFPSAFNGQVRDFQLPVAKEDLQTARNIASCQGGLTNSPQYPRHTLAPCPSARLSSSNSIVARCCPDASL